MRISDWSSDVCSSDLLADNKKWGARRVQEIARRDIRELIDGIEERGAPVAANRTLAAVRKMFNWAVERDILDASPVAGIQPPGAETSRSEKHTYELQSLMRNSYTVFFLHNKTHYALTIPDFS